MSRRDGSSRDGLSEPSGVPVTKFRPLGDRVLIKLDRLPEKVGLLYVPATAKRAPSLYGTVIATGPGMLCKDGRRWPMPVKAGDRVIISSEQPLELKIDGEPHILVRDDNVLAIDEPAEEAAQ